MPYTINGTSGLPASGVKQADLATGVAGVGPAFSAYQSVAQALSISTWAKLTMNIEEYDTANLYDNTTYRFTPTVAGYYQFNLGMYGTAAGTAIVSLYKNGASFKASPQNSTATTAISATIYLNGTTDYVEPWGFMTTAQNTGPGASQTYFQGHLVRAA